MYVGKPEEDRRVLENLHLLIASAESSKHLHNPTNPFSYSKSISNATTSIEQCRIGFDETDLFQIPAIASTGSVL